MCAMEFKQELEYWDINPDLIGDCCWNQYRPFLLPDRDHASSPDPDGCRETMWKILELKHSGRVSKVTRYFVYGVGLSVSIFFKVRVLSTSKYGSPNQWALLYHSLLRCVYE